MDRKIKLLAATTLAAMTTAACTPNGGANAPHSQQTQGSMLQGSTTSPVTHSHSGKVHSHLLPDTGIRHTHNTGTGPDSTPAPQAPVVRNDGRTHSHSGKVHTHNLPATGINHTHQVGGATQQQYSAPQYSAPPATNNQSAAAPPANPNAHSHNGRVHSHPLPASGLTHSHNTGGRPQAPQPAPQVPNYPQVPSYNQPPIYNNVNTYQPQVPAGNNSGGTTHSHNGRTHSHPLPASGTNHNHNTGGGAGASNAYVQPQQPVQNNSASSYYDYSANNTAPNYGTNAPVGNSQGSYYDSSSDGSQSAYYDNVKPKGAAPSAGGSSYYDYSAPSGGNNSASSGYTSNSVNTGSSGGFQPNNYQGGNSYTVQRGDTVFQVMRNTGVYWKDIIRINNLTAPNYQINPGQVLRLR